MHLYFFFFTFLFLFIFFLSLFFFFFFFCGGDGVGQITVSHLSRTTKAEAAGGGVSTTNWRNCLNWLALQYIQYHPSTFIFVAFLFYNGCTKIGTCVVSAKTKKICISIIKITEIRVEKVQYWKYFTAICVFSVFFMLI